MQTYKPYSIGIMQGRLTPRGAQSIQFFPFDNWQQEFKDAAKIGLDEIEWIFDYERFEQNPLWTDNGVKEICELVAHYKVRIKVICADYFMRRPFFGSNEIERKDTVAIFENLIRRAHAVGATVVEIPLLDNSSMKGVQDMEIMIDILRDIAPVVQENEMVVHLETDLAPAAFASFLRSIPDQFVRVTYDSGNSSGLGYDPAEEITAYGDRIAHIHIKDRVCGGTTVPLGTGDAKFDTLFTYLKKIHYTGSFILQAARGLDGKETDTITRQKEFVTDYVNRYLRHI